MSESPVKRARPVAEAPPADRWLLVRFALAYLLSWGALLWAIDTPALEFLRLATARAAGALLDLSGIPTTVAGCYLSAGEGVTVVSGRCMPLQAMALGIALTVSSARLSHLGRAIWATVAVAAVLAVNVLRVAAVSALVATEASWLDAAHAYVLPVLLAVTAVAAWLLAERVGPHG